MEKISEYAIGNKDDLSEMASIASKYLSDTNNRIFMDENGEIKLSTDVYREYVDINDLQNVDSNDIKALKEFFVSTDVDDIFIRNDINQATDEVLTETEDSYIFMHLLGDVHGSINYYIYFIDVDDASLFSNPLEGYDKGGFQESIGSDNHSVSWLSDHRTDFKSSESHFMYKADIIKAADGIWIGRQEIQAPAYDLFING